MPKINILESKVYNRISAGEVVERPANVVKELVENSLDAGATSISIEIEEGGTKLIKICDNGCGIDFDDLKTAFLPHATSKICSADDLDSISTLGFRGEALASIGAVSQAEIISKTISSDIGGKISISGGVIDTPTIFACNNGTIITVKNLFFNTPARLKFLKSPKQEEMAITNIVDRLILSHPEVAFKYSTNGKTVYNSPLRGLNEKIYTIYGKNISQNLISVEEHSGNFSLSGYISTPTSCKANRTYQTLIINGRYVTNSLISVAISNAYQNFLMKGKFPLFVLNLTLPFEDIDVNVHPSKMEVRFKDTKAIYNFIYSTILQALQNSNFPLEFDNLTQNPFNFVPDKKVDSQLLQEVKGGFSFSDMQNFAENLKNINVSAPVFDSEKQFLASSDAFSQNIKNDELQNQDKDYFVNNEQSSNKNSNSFNEEILPSNDFQNQNLHNDLQYKNDFSNFDRKEFGGDYSSNFTNPFANKFNKLVQEKFDKNLAYKCIGTLFNTYLLVESNDSFFMIDQHAGHERVLFDKFMAMFEQKKLNSQPLLIPYVFDVNPLEQTLLEDNLEVFSKMGFVVEHFGNNTYRVSEVPAILSGIDIEEFITESLSNINKISSSNEQITNHFATCACKAAVKGGQNLSDNEVEYLLNEIIRKNYRLQCPHGRPVCIRFSKYEVEKLFKRIVT